INPHNGFVKSLWQALLAVTEPVLGRIRRFLPDMGGIDISPIILILLIQFIKIVVLGNLQQSIISIPATTG
ncbi:MAG TPA: YggT family protein, partial [Hyphomicrobiaceae bacterium]|nr:YggT family protein [Hyphomicrobiaceae bacterium]